MTFFNSSILNPLDILGNTLQDIILVTHEAKSSKIVIKSHLRVRVIIHDSAFFVL